MVALLVSEALYTYTARLHGQVHEERTNGEGGGGAPVGRRRVGAFWGVDNSERVAIKGRIGKKAPLAKLRTCLSTLPRIHIHKWTARERGMGGERLKSRSFPLFPLSLSSLLIQRGNVYIDAFSGFKTGARVTITKLNVKIRALTFLER